MPLKDVDTRSPVTNRKGYSASVNVSLNGKQLLTWIFLIILLWVGWKVFTTDGRSVFEKYYHGFALAPNPPGSTSSPVSEAYRRGAWQEVIVKSKEMKAFTPGDLLLVALANIELKNTEAADLYFKMALNLSEKNNDASLLPQLNYFSGMSYLASENNALAIARFSVIRNDEKNPYRDSVLAMKRELLILDLKK
ncbi:MAG: hypothetical protein EOO02_06930 [Chitinophagaceae bacterium]|nr:MAG: hypothetical protein EOO02_06930 [Chitinophagaceae bacterium]